MHTRSPCEITFGRTDGTATKTSPVLSRTKALKLANGLAFVFFNGHPFAPSKTHGATRFEGQGFFVEYKEVVLDAHL